MRVNSSDLKRCDQQQTRAAGHAGDAGEEETTNALNYPKHVENCFLLRPARNSPDLKRHPSSSRQQRPLITVEGRLGRAILTRTKKKVVAPHVAGPGVFCAWQTAAGDPASSMPRLTENTSDGGHLRRSQRLAALPLWRDWPPVCQLLRVAVDSRFPRASEKTGLRVRKLPAGTTKHWLISTGLERVD